MKLLTRRSVLVLFSLTAVFWLAAAGFLSAATATIPAGTDLVVKTLDSISSTDSPGKSFGARLLNDVTVGGRVVLPAGTQFTGRVATSRQLISSDERLTVDLAQVVVGGRAIPVKTAGPVPMEGFTTARGISISRGTYQVAAGRALRFRLGQPLKL